MRVVITGGTGLIGSELAASLAQDGHEVIVLSRRPEAAHKLPAGVRAAGWDGRTGRGWVEVADGADAIVNLAGENLGAGRWTSDRKIAILQSRQDAGRAVVQAVAGATHKPGVVIQASAIGYYGPHGDETVIESTPPGKDYLAAVCRAWEQSSAGMEQFGVRRVVVRSGLVLTARGGALPRLLLPFRFFVGGPLGSGRQWFSWIHLADEVAALRFLIERPDAAGAFNLAAPGPVTNAQLAATIGRVLHRPALLRTPAFVLRRLLGEMATMVVDGQRVVPRRLQSLGFSFRYPDIESALRNL